MTWQVRYVLKLKILNIDICGMFTLWWLAATKQIGVDSILATVLGHICVRKVLFILDKCYQKRGHIYSVMSRIRWCNLFSRPTSRTCQKWAWVINTISSVAQSGRSCEISPPSPGAGPVIHQRLWWCYAISKMYGAPGIPRVLMSLKEGSWGPHVEIGVLVRVSGAPRQLMVPPRRSHAGFWPPRGFLEPLRRALGAQRWLLGLL